MKENVFRNEEQYRILQIRAIYKSGTKSGVKLDEIDRGGLGSTGV